jgi:hypothetical protein
MQALKGAEYRSEKYGLTFFYPHSMVTSTSQKFIRLMDENIFGVESLGAQGRFKTQVGLAVRAQRAGLDDLDPMSYIPGGAQPLAIIRKEPIMVGGAAALRLKYSVMSQSEGSWYPELVLVYTDIVPKDERTFIFSFHAARPNFESDVPVYSALLNSVIWN